MRSYDEVMKGVKETTKFPKAIEGSKGLLSRPEAEWLNRIPKVLGPGVYAELGTFRGRSACLLADAMVDSRLITVDTFMQKGVRHKYRSHNVYDEVMALFKSRGFDWIDVVVSTSLEAAVDTPDESLLFLFIDADHSYESVKGDFNAWESKLTREGIIAFHDSHLETVSRFLHELVDWEEFDRVDTLSAWSRK